MGCRGALYKAKVQSFRIDNPAAKPLVHVLVLSFAAIYPHLTDLPFIIPIVAGIACGLFAGFISGNLIAG